MWLCCRDCNVSFEVADSQWRYQEKKKPGRDWFCSRTCTTHFSNIYKRSDEYKSKRNERIRQYSGKHPSFKEHSPFAWYIHRIKYEKRVHARAVDVDLEELLNERWIVQGGKCNISGVELERRDHKGKTLSDDNFSIASVDRIDSSKPYGLDNIQWISVALNLAKSNTPNDVFVRNFHRLFN